MSRDINHPVKRRRVFYVPGYDPIPARRYRELYRKESAAQAAISGYKIDMRAAGTDQTYGWQVDAVIEDQAVTADVSVLIWSDIVRDSMKATIPATYLQLLRTAWIYIGSGALWRLMRLRPGPVAAALYPVVALLLQMLAAVLAFVLLWAGGALLWQGPGGFIGAALGGAAFVLVLRWFQTHDNRFYAYYLMHDFAYSAAWKGAYPQALEARMAAFGDLIAEALASDVDEVLVVGHSSGAHLSVSILSDLIRAGRVPEDGPALALLSLGHVVPMVSFLPDAYRLRADLRYLSACDALTWVDVTAMGDGCTFALCDPVGVTGVAPPNKRWPLVFSAAFSQTMSAERWQSLRRKYFTLHFMYLCAFERPRDYDYFQITAGPRSLAARYRNRNPSKSRIETPTSKYRSVAP